MIRSSLLAVPKRLPVLWAKLLVFASVTFVLMLIAAFIGFLGAQAIFTEHHVNASLSTTHALRTIFGAVLFMTATGALSVALGTIVRRTAGGIALFVGVFFVLPGLVEIASQSSTADAIHPYLPSNAGGVIAQVLPDPHMFSAWGGFALFCGYTALTIALAAWLLLKRDA